MNQLKILLRHWVMAFLYPRPLVGLLYLPRFFSHWVRYARSINAQKISVLDLQPCLGDWTTHTPFDAHYFYQGAWLARRVCAAKVAKHVDIGSSVLTMSVLSALIETVFVDYRPLKTSLPGLTSIAGNILDLPFSDDSIKSLSCLHVIEHIGLGRYGDPLDPLGSVKAALELQRVVSHGGSLLLSMPIGRERICFNAHRVHDANSVLKLFPQMKLMEFSYVDDAGQYNEYRSVEDAMKLEYGCGLFRFEKSF
jgi:SAM-dependent methyltransferase